jgi:hypothetical protein
MWFERYEQNTSSRDNISTELGNEQEWIKSETMQLRSESRITARKVDYVRPVQKVRTCVAHG